MKLKTCFIQLLINKKQNMKKLTVTLILSFMMVFAWANNNGDGIKFNEGSWAEVAKKAKKTKKLIFIECYTVW